MCAVQMDGPRKLAALPLSLSLSSQSLLSPRSFSFSPTFIHESSPCRKPATACLHLLHTPPFARHPPASLSLLFPLPHSVLLLRRRLSRSRLQPPRPWHLRHQFRQAQLAPDT